MVYNTNYYFLKAHGPWKNEWPVVVEHVVIIVEWKQNGETYQLIINVKGGISWIQYPGFY